MTLTEFLLARIAEDEAVAQEATPGPWRDTPMGSEGSIVQAGGFDWRTARKPATCREFADATHIARHDPARVLAECEAKRRIVADEHFDGRSGDSIAPWCSTCSEDENLVDLPCPTLRHLAAVYADHPDYAEGGGGRERRRA